MIQPNDPTHPITCENDDRGLTKREHFAALALQGLLTGAFVSDPEDWPSGIKTQADWVRHTTTSAVEYADALIDALNAQKESPR